jgi:hypothetical protein
MYAGVRLLNRGALQDTPFLQRRKADAYSFYSCNDVYLLYCWVTQSSSNLCVLLLHTELNPTLNL